MHGGMGGRDGDVLHHHYLTDLWGEAKVCGNIETEGGAGRGNNEEWGSG